MSESSPPPAPERTDESPTSPDSPIAPRLIVQRIFVVCWLFLGLAGALNHTIAQKLLGHRLDLRLPQLRWGYVMFNQNPQRVRVHEYSGADGVRHDLADLLQTPSLGYSRARVAINSMVQPRSIQEICRQAAASIVDANTSGRTNAESAGRSGNEVDLIFYESEYSVTAGVSTRVRTLISRCDAHGLTRQ